MFGSLSRDYPTGSCGLINSLIRLNFTSLEGGVSLVKPELLGRVTCHQCPSKQAFMTDWAVGVGENCYTYLTMLLRKNTKKKKHFSFIKSCFLPVKPRMQISLQLNVGQWCRNSIFLPSADVLNWGFLIVWCTKCNMEALKDGDTSSVWRQHIYITCFHPKGSWRTPTKPSIYTYMQYRYFFNTS